MNNMFTTRFFKLSLLVASLFPLPVAFAKGDSEEITSPDDTHYAAIIKIDSEDAIEDLEKAGVEILRRRDELLLCYIPYSYSNGNARKSRSIKKTPGSPKGIVKIERGRQVAPNMDKAREWFEASSIHSSSPTFPPFTGKGVVAGICDIGIDPLHIAFLDSAGEPRIKRIVQYKEGSGERILLESKEEYENWKTDNYDNWHASHVANIMAGGFGDYRGMAPDADIVVTTSQLSDVGLLCGAEDILEYAKEQGKRAVINMSMGNYTGPHDGTSLFSQYLDRIAEEALVVLSAGNAGNSNFTLPVDFSESLPSAALALYSHDWVQFNPYGAVDIWSANASPLRVRFGIRDADQGRTLILYPWQELHNGDSFTVTSNPSDASDVEGAVTIFDETFASIYSGWFELQGNIDSENGRYQALLQYDAHTDIVSSGGPWARYVPIVEVAGNPGTHADIYADWQFTLFRSLPDQPEPGSLLSFSDLATGQNIISVGMYVNRDHTPNIAGEDFSISRKPGSIAPESGYSTLLDGRVMPSTVAPGYNVVSAISRHYWDAHPDSEPINAETVLNGDRYLWVTNHGTSMSAPYVAGTLACWLEAVPSLTSSQAQQVIAQTNRFGSTLPDIPNPRHGQGYLDPAAGLKLAISAFSSTGSIFPEYGLNKNDNNPRLSLECRKLIIWNPEGMAARIEVTDMAGTQLISSSISSTIEKIDLSSLSPGVYIAHIPGSKARLKFRL